MQDMPPLLIRIDLWFLPILLLLLAAAAWGLYRLGVWRRTRLWRRALSDLPFGIVVVGAGGRRRYENRSAGLLLQQLDAPQLDELRRAAEQDLQRATMLRGHNGAVVRAQARRFDAGEVLLTLQDVAPQQEAEGRYRRFIHTLSHELLTPLTAIQGHLANIHAGTAAEAPYSGSLRVVQDEVDRLTRLISNLLILSRLEAGQPLQKRPTNLSAVAEEATLQLLERAEARGVTLDVQADARLARPAVDRDAWKQVFLNLVDNAIKYGRQGGHVDVVLRQHGARIDVSVADDGPGIEPADLPHLFEELWRADAQRHVGGSGLGLAIVRRIVEQHDGQISATSEPGRGTTFHISLPLARDVVTTP